MLKILLKSMALLVLMLGMGVTLPVSAETATATDQETEEVIVAREVLQRQNQASPSSPSAIETETEVATPQIANDMAEGQLQRDLPNMNEPVIDQANLLSPAEKQQLSQRILKLYNEGKGQIGIVIVPTTGQEDIFSYSMRVAEAWQLGSAKRDNGLLMTIAVNDRRIQILTGYGLEGVLPDIVAGRIINDKITPYFKQGQYAQGIDSGLAEIERILNLDPEIAAQAADELKERQEQVYEQVYQAQKASQATLSSVIFIVIAGVIGSMMFGRKLSAATAAVAGTAAGLVNGLGLIASLMIGIGVFFVLITSLAQLVLHAFMSGAGRGGSGRGGFGGGGFGGGGGGFGGGGASGSW